MPLIWSAVTRGPTVLAECGEDNRAGEVLRLAQKILRKKATPGWESERAGSLRALKFHVYSTGPAGQPPPGPGSSSSSAPEPVVWSICCVYDSEFPELQVRWRERCLSDGVSGRQGALERRGSGQVQKGGGYRHRAGIEAGGCMPRRAGSGALHTWRQSAPRALSAPTEAMLSKALSPPSPTFTPFLKKVWPRQPPRGSSIHPNTYNIIAAVQALVRGPPFTPYPSSPTPIALRYPLPHPPFPLQARGFLEKLALMSEPLRNTPTWLHGRTLAAQDAFAPTLLQRMEQASSGGRLAMVSSKVPHERMYALNPPPRSRRWTVVMVSSRMRVVRRDARLPLPGM
jgi:hypothetical protein